MKIVVAGKYNDKALKLFQEMCPEGYSLDIVGTPSEEELTKKVADADILFVRGRVELTDNMLEQASKLKLIQKWGAGFDQYDMKQIGRYNIPFMNCMGINSVQVSEMTIALILALYRRILPVATDMKKGVWSKEQYLPDCRTIHGKVAGVIGIGNIGRCVAKLIRAFGAEVVYYDAFRLSEEKEKELGVTYMDLPELIKTADIVTLHVPLLPSTENMFNAEVLATMKKNAVVINAARGGIVNEKDLYEALVNKTIAGAALDVLQDEENQSESTNPLFTLPNVVITPHMGASTDEVLQAMVERFYEDVVGVVGRTIDPHMYQNYKFFTNPM